MYQRSPHEPRYKQSTRARELRHAESNEYSGVSSSSSEEEEESSDRYTEETEENSVVSQECQSYQETLKSVDRNNRTTKQSSYRPFSRIPKKDQFTQKNLLSPFPSYWAPPERTEVSGNTYYKVSKAMPKEDRCSSEKSPKPSTKKKESQEGNDGLAKLSSEKRIEKNKSGKKSSSLKIVQPEQIDRFDHRKTPGKLLEPLVEDLTKNFAAKGSLRRAKTSQEIEFNNQMTEKCPDCVALAANHSKSKRKSGVATASAEKERNSQEVALSKDIGDGKLAKNKGKEVKEKLVYVVEEEGKDATKIETDIFSLSEILVIKKDLIELSEFAKKLKRVKEMKKDSESNRNKKSSCHCHPAEELLRDVSRRIEALEERQVELERRSQSGKRIRKPKVLSKMMVKPKTSVSTPKTPVLVNIRAAATVPNDPKTENLERRGEGFACNSDIFNELMDIKTQLEKLEKKRLLKEASNETKLQKNANLNNPKDHAIAVFSSKTYILTTENFSNVKNGKAIGEKSRKDLTKENVINWLQNVSQDRANNDVSIFLSPDANRDDFKCENHIQVLKREDFENQEPQKNRASENLQRGVDMSITCFVKNQHAEEPDKFGERKKCVMTSSGRFVTVSESQEHLEKIPRKECNRQPPHTLSPLRTMPKIVHRSASSGSIPSTVLIKRQLKRLKSHLMRKKHRNDMKIIQSKSTSTIVSKPDKIEENQQIKNSENLGSITSSNDKKRKEGKTEFLKRLEAQFMTIAKNLGMVYPSSTSYSYSELLATVDLEASNSKKWPRNLNDNQIMVYSASKKKYKDSSSKKKKCKKKKPEKDCQSMKSCKKECKKMRKKRKMEEKNRRALEAMHENCVPKHKSQHKHKKLNKKKKSKPSHCICDHHSHCHSSLTLHPRHPLCETRAKKQDCCIKDGDFLEEERNTTSRSTECCCSICTQECISPPEEPTPPKCCCRPSIINPTTPTEKCRKLKRRSLMNESLNLNRGLFKKFFKNIGRCNPLFSEKELNIAPRKYCAKRRRCLEPEFESEEKYCPPKNCTPSKRTVHCEPECSPSPDTSHRRACHFQKKLLQCCQNHRSPHKPRHHSQDCKHHCKHSRRSPHHVCLNHSQKLHSTRTHYYIVPEKFQMGKYKCEFIEPFMENKDLSSRSSFKAFELIEDENKSKKKAKKCKKNDSEFLKSNHQVYLLNPRSDDFGKATKSLSCFCSKCGNIHRRHHKFVYPLTDQKAVNRKLQRPLNECTLQEKFEDEYRGQYDNYDNYNFDRYVYHDLDYKSEQLDNHKEDLKSDQYDDLKFCQRGSEFEAYNVISKKNHYNEFKVGYFTDSTPRCCESSKSRDSSKKDETFPFFSFFSKIFRLKCKKPEEDHFKPKKTHGCQCKEKFDRLETRMNEVERGLFSISYKASSKKHKSRTPRKRNSKRLSKEEKKSKKDLQNTARKLKKRDNIERRRCKDLRELEKFQESNIKSTKDCEAAALYYTINTPSLVSSTLCVSPQTKKLFQAKSSFQFQRKINDGLISLQSCWLNLRNHKFNSVRNLLNKMRRKSLTDSNFPIDDSGRSSKIPRMKQVTELKDEPTNFNKKHTKSKKKDRKKRKEKVSPKNKRRRGRYRQLHCCRNF